VHIIMLKDALFFCTEFVALCIIVIFVFIFCLSIYHVLFIFDFFRSWCEGKG